MSAKNDHRYVLIMAGGAGTRLWPLSRRDHPKQFQSFVGDQSLLQHMADLVRATVPIDHVFVMAVPAFSDIITKQLPDLPEANLLFEPARRDTGPAVSLGLMQIHQRDPEAIVTTLWSDHLIQNPEGFTQMLECGFETIAERPEQVCVVGVNPTFANTGFGYIQMGKEVSRCGELPVFTVKRFVEKPDLETATKLVASWDYLWNVGYEVLQAAHFLSELTALQPELAETLNALQKGCAEDDKDAITKHYEELPKISIEYLFTQKVSNLVVIPADLGWSDLGAWNVLHDVLREQHPEKMVTRGETMLVDSSNSLVFAKDRPIALVGVKDLIVVDDGDVVLIMHKDAAQSIKKLTEALDVTQSPLL